MRSNDENVALADILFPDIKESPEDIFKRYPQRELGNGSMVLRFAPSPTGFLHIGSVYAGFLCTKLAKQSGGISILRIEDTDKGREVEKGVSLIANGLKGFGVEFDEGMVDEDMGIGEYGPYIQSQRLDIYHTFAKDFVRKGYLYPCFLTKEELQNIRDEQNKKGERTGCYGKWAKWRDASLDSVKIMLEKGSPYVLRLRSTGDIEKRFNFKDMVKGGLTLRQNDMDVVLVKSDGFPTYHFAHPIDDVLMGITHIIRADEWFPSVPLHVELFEKFGFQTIPYGHISPLMKMEGSSKRKLSKRKDPEADVAFFIENGYPKEAILEYMLNIANSNFYDWRIQNPKGKLDDFILKIEKFNNAGALFDMVKLEDMCKDYIARLSAEDVYDLSLEWSLQYDKQIAKLLSENRDYCINILNIERTGERIRKDIVKFKDVRNQLIIFFDELWLSNEYEDISDRVPSDLQKEIIKRYVPLLVMEDTLDVWFGKIKDLSAELGLKPGDIAMVLRVAITKSIKSPDLYQIIQVLGRDNVIERLEKYPV